MCVWRAPSSAALVKHEICKVIVNSSSRECRFRKDEQK